MNKIILKYGSTAVGREAELFLEGLRNGVHTVLGMNSVFEYYIIAAKNEIHVLSARRDLINLVWTQFPYLCHSS